MIKNISLFTIFFISSFFAFAQEPVDYAEPKEFEIGGIEVIGAGARDPNAIKSVAGLKKGDMVKIPGDKITNAIKKLWKLRLFTDVNIGLQKVIGDVAFLEIVLKERPVLYGHSYTGVKQNTHEDLNSQVKRFLLKGGVVTSNSKSNAINAIKEYYIEKGFLDVEASVTENPVEGVNNAVKLTFDIDKGKRVKIKQINFTGIEAVKPKKVKKRMKNTREIKSIFHKSKLMEDDFEEDKKSVIAYYNTIGYRDAQIIQDSIWRDEDGKLIIDIVIAEGEPYYFRDITWKGNTKYNEEYLTEVLGIEKGDIYDKELLDQRLSFSLDGRDISSLYLDDGYLFFRVDPVETSVEKDSIDLEMRMYEGPQATIDKVVIKGNDRTNEHVIRRELRTKPGQKFSRKDIMRSQREIINLGYFDPESIVINTPVNPQKGTVDIEYIVSERPSDQLELSAGYGGYGLVGTLGLAFNNFSINNITNKSAWRPLPQGDGQSLSVRAQTSGQYYQSYNISFTEPWLGGKKPTSFSIGGYYNRFTNGQPKTSTDLGELSILRFYTGLGTRLKFPDDNFLFRVTANIEDIKINNYPGIFSGVGDGVFHNYFLNFELTRSSVSEPIFPRGGSKFSLSAQVTPPYSAFSDKDYPNLDVGERFKWVEYHKWKFTSEWYANLFGKLVLKSELKMGFLGSYNKDLGLSPFERFEITGDPLTSQQVGITGRDILYLRGYESNTFPTNSDGGAPLFTKATMELRYPISLNPSSTIYALAFVQGGNTWANFGSYNPFDLKRSAGFGIRAFLPMFGLIGFDYGFGFDQQNLINTNAKWSDYAKFSFILGFEPE